MDISEYYRVMIEYHWSLYSELKDSDYPTALEHARISLKFSELLGV